MIEGFRRFFGGGDKPEVPEDIVEVQIIPVDRGENPTERPGVEKGRIQDNLRIPDIDDFLDKEKKIDKDNEKSKVPHNDDGNTLN